MPIEITYSEYVKLSETEKIDFVIVNQSESVRNITNNTTNVSNKTDDLLGLGKVAETAAVVAILPFAIVKSWFD